MFGGDSIIGFYNHPRFSFVKADVRDIETIKPLLSEVDAIVIWPLLWVILLAQNNLNSLKR